jgi:hypothetical protein
VLRDARERPGKARDREGYAVREALVVVGVAHGKAEDLLAPHFTIRRHKLKTSFFCHFLGGTRCFFVPLVYLGQVPHLCHCHCHCHCHRESATATAATADVACLRKRATTSGVPEWPMCAM